MKRIGIIIVILFCIIVGCKNVVANSKNTYLPHTTYNILYKFVPADPRPRTIQQPNGKMLTFYIKGDERISWCETLDGYTLLYGDSKHLEFACVDENGTLQPSGILACNEEERGEEELSFLMTIKKQLFFSKEQTDEMFKRFYRK